MDSRESLTCRNFDGPKLEMETRASLKTSAGSLLCDLRVLSYEAIARGLMMHRIEFAAQRRMSSRNRQTDRAQADLVE
jgi:hypothetical protein